MKHFFPAIGWLATVTYLSVTPKLQLPKFNLFSADKLGHIAAYALLTWLLVWGISKSKRRTATQGESYSALFFATFYGALMEWVQGTFFPGRFFEFDDMLANAAGALFATILYRLL